MAEKRQYRADKDCFRDGRVVRAGETFYYDGKPSDWMIPLDEPKRTQAPVKVTKDIAE